MHAVIPKAYDGWRVSFCVTTSTVKPEVREDNLVSSCRRLRPVRCVERMLVRWFASVEWFQPGQIQEYVHRIPLSNFLGIWLAFWRSMYALGLKNTPYGFRRLGALLHNENKMRKPGLLIPPIGGIVLRSI